MSRKKEMERGKWVSEEGEKARCHPGNWSQSRDRRLWSTVLEVEACREDDSTPCWLSPAKVEDSGGSRRPKRAGLMCSFHAGSTFVPSGPSMASSQDSKGRELGHTILPCLPRLASACNNSQFVVLLCTLEIGIAIQNIWRILKTHLISLGKTTERYPT